MNFWRGAIILSLTIIWSHIGFAQEEIVKEYHRNGKLKILGKTVNGLKEGKWVEYNLNGARSKFSWYTHDYLDSVLYIGSTKRPKRKTIFPQPGDRFKFCNVEYDLKGHKKKEYCQFECETLADCREVTIEFFPNGQKHRLIGFLNDDPYKTSRAWNKDGQLLRDMRLTRGGRRTDTCRYYYPEGGLSSEDIFSGIQLQYRTQWHKNGAKKGFQYPLGRDSIGHRVDSWYPSGKLSTKELEYTDSTGARHYLQQGWWENGQMSYRRQKVGRKNEGQWQEWHNNGQLSKSEYYQNGVRHGEFRDYYADGQLQFSACYTNGKRDGVELYYTSEGVLNKELHFNEGESFYYLTFYPNSQPQSYYQSYDRDKYRVDSNFYWLENGTMTGWEFLKHSKKHDFLEWGKEIDWYADGQLYRIKTLSPQLDSEKYWWENGQPKKVEFRRYKFPGLMGRYRARFSEKLQDEGFQTRVKTWKEWSEEGRQLSEAKHHRGVEKKSWKVLSNGNIEKRRLKSGFYFIRPVHKIQTLSSDRRKKIAMTKVKGKKRIEYSGGNKSIKWKRKEMEITRSNHYSEKIYFNPKGRPLRKEMLWDGRIFKEIIFEEKGKKQKKIINPHLNRIYKGKENNLEPIRMSRWEAGGDYAVLSGKVLDRETGDMLPFVNVVLNGGSSNSNGAATDIDGFFKISQVPAGTYHLVITYPGYKHLSYDLEIKRGEALKFEILISSY